MPIKIVAISGSLSKHSPHSGLLRASLQLNPPDLQIIICDISDFPLFNLDIILQTGYPPAVQHLRDAILTADALLFALAEDNGKVSAALKNAYDWASFAKDPNSSPIKGKPAGVMAVSAAQAIKHFHNVVQYCGLNMMKKDLQLEEENFDQMGRPTEETVGKLKPFLSELQEHILQSKA